MITIITITITIIITIKSSSSKNSNGTIAAKDKTNDSNITFKRNGKKL